MRILLAEDDQMIGESIQRGLRQDGYAVDWVGDGVAAEHALADHEYGLVLLDLGLPRKDGIRFLEDLRRRHNRIPVLVLTAQDSVEFKVDALRIGADDYVTKPFAMEELLARVEAISRRPKSLAHPVLQIADLRIDTGSRQVTRGGDPIELTPKEYSVLLYLARHQGRVMSRTLITEYVWDYHFDPGTNIVDVVINRLRKKIDQGHEPKLIHTMRGVGFVVRACRGQHPGHPLPVVHGRPRGDRPRLRRHHLDPGAPLQLRGARPAPDRGRRRGGRRPGRGA